MKTPPQKKSRKRTQRGDESVQVSVTLNPANIQRGKRKAKEDGRSFSNWVNRVLEKELAKIEAANQAEPPV